MKYTLTAEEQQLAIDAGRRKFERRRDTPHRWNRPAGDYTLEKAVEDFGAEIAVAWHLGVAWVEKPHPDPEGDVAPGVQVRHTRYSNGLLLLHDDEEKPDRDDHIFYLTTGRFPTYNIRGWISGRRGKLEGKQVELQPGRPCIGVEQRQLQEAT